MSDFDKEAEREKLREKYERDKKEREATQRMSDLLLKGATMTNSHCGTCGDPLFQQNGTTFCPSCHGTPDAVEGTDLEAQSTEEVPTDDGSTAGENGATQAADAGSTAGDSASSEALEEASTAADRRDSATGRPDQTGRQDQARAEPGDRTDSPSRARGSETSRPTDDPRREPANGATNSAPPRDDPSRPAPEASAGRRPAQPAVDGDLEAGRDSLVRALEKFADEAAATDDPRYARECLEAAREASETLNVLR
ncbi:Sjogren's syndrome/scleroderma autoantigen 1 family protein [Natrialba sp. INN-245]|uniref:Sjogren's syndrome/scleroderma autoantigen 1 family protein n=1 Tax=Natrialba sp. INN-245 TaxID=2690967 RepID=UPI0013105858|nr:Sjogren's syndrome/scleroderma autoantigen 1 family protein [Natrialba sp. INN-245]MWV41842.1 hypothetical protein [Natrialba sp. INN-245]